jgi:hypothetical protein
MKPAARGTRESTPTMHYDAITVELRRPSRRHNGGKPRLVAERLRVFFN